LPKAAAAAEFDLNEGVVSTKAAAKPTKPEEKKAAPTRQTTIAAAGGDELASGD
jgi:hypothetical protein